MEFAFLRQRVQRSLWIDGTHNRMTSSALSIMASFLPQRNPNSLHFIASVAISSGSRSCKMPNRLNLFQRVRSTPHLSLSLSLSRTSLTHPLVSLPHKGYKQGKRPVGYWKAVAKRRQFFCDFAKRQGFDPLKAEEWKNVTKSQIIEARVCNFYHLK